MIEINIAKDFATSPGARLYEDGDFSGQQFFDEILRTKYKEAVSQGLKLKIILDGTDGIASSFLNEAFRRLGEEFGGFEVWKNLIIISDEVPKYITRIKNSLNEVKKK